MRREFEIVVSAFASTLVVMIVYAIFPTLTNDTLFNLVMNTLQSPAGALSINAASLGNTAGYVKTFMNVIPLILIFTIVFEMIINLGWRTEENAY
jgi:cellobiose-specific phosphotransferase system component IIC